LNFNLFLTHPLVLWIIKVMILLFCGFFSMRYWWRRSLFHLWNYFLNFLAIWSCFSLLMDSKFVFIIINRRSLWVLAHHDLRVRLSQRLARNYIYWLWHWTEIFILEAYFRSWEVDVLDLLSKDWLLSWMSTFGRVGSRHEVVLSYLNWIVSWISALAGNILSTFHSLSSRTYNWYFWFRWLFFILTGAI